jgi:hypothetical protein
VSQQYTLIRHEDIIFQAIEECSALRHEYGHEKVDIKLFDHGGRMSYDITWPEHTMEIEKGDVICPLFHGANSYDLSTHLMSEYGLLRLACGNGMVVDSVESNIRRKHIGSTSLDNVRLHIRTSVDEFRK